MLKITNGTLEKRITYWEQKANGGLNLDGKSFGGPKTLPAPGGGESRGQNLQDATREV